MRFPWVMGLFILLFLLMDLYVFQSVQHVSASWSVQTRNRINWTYWCISLITVFILVLFISTEKTHPRNAVKFYAFALVMGLFIAKLTAMVFFVVDDGRRLIQWTWQRTQTLTSIQPNTDELTISRSTFISWLGLAMGGTLFGTLLYGFSNSYNYQVIRQRLRFPGIHASLEGLRIVHISDIHAGSFTNQEAVEKGIEKIQSLNPDLILFTGDLVNNLAKEMNDYEHIFAKLNAPLGVYSVLGNHDYGDYVPWPDDGGISKQKNLEDLKRIQQRMGWQLLLNEHLVLEKGGAQFALIGIENWGAKARFSRYGDLSKATIGLDSSLFSILMSHDPSHWRAQVLQDFKHINLTLSGHTHGMQFGVEIPGFRWSPVQYLYPEWAGQYQQSQQQLYVNRGFGFLGYPGRVGMLPEITLIELSS
jgi:predicted MPP superfamily phosphohydrolase